jgi:hypothetical protein
MFERESDLEEESGLLRNGKRYKRSFGSYILGQDTAYTSVSQSESEPEETPFVGNPPITPQRRFITLEKPSQSESNPSQNSPVADPSTSVSSPFAPFVPPPRHSLPPPPPLLLPLLLPGSIWLMETMMLSSRYLQELDQMILNSFGSYAKLFGQSGMLEMKISN